MISTTTHIVNITHEEIDILTNLGQKVSINPSNDQNRFCNEVKELSKHIPIRIRDILHQFAKEGSKTGFLLIRSIPFEDSHIGHTPTGNNYMAGESTLLAKIQALIMCCLGEMIAYEAEGYGRLFQDIVPSKEMATVQTSLGSQTELEIHTEQAFSQLRPDTLSLACLRGDPNAMTYILPVVRILQHLTQDEINILQKPLWETGVDLSFKLNGNEFLEGDVRGPMPILRGSVDTKLVFDQDLMKGITEESQRMISRIVDIYYKERIAHNLKPGEIIFIDNNRAVHGRSPFSPRYDGYDRFLVRSFAVFDYEKSKTARMNGTSRTVAAIYS
jgi:L-asparagine oxygenase